MRIKQSRIFPYPVCSEEKDDYLHGLSFDVELDYDSEKATFHINPRIEDKAIQMLLDNESAGLFCHIECSTTKYRELFPIRLEDNKVIYDIEVPLYKINDSVEVILLIVALEDINGFMSSELNELFKGENIHFPQFATIGYTGTIELVVTKQMDINGDVPSIFAITKSDSQSIMTCDYTEPQIIIYLPEDVYDIYYNLKGVYKRIKQMMLILPVLVNVIDAVKNDPGDLEGCAWYTVLENAYKKKGFSDGFNDQAFLSKQSLELAQLALGDLINDAFKEMASIND